MKHTPSDWAPLQLILQDILLNRKDGVSEYELFAILKSPPYEVFSSEALSDPLSLFQNHFILFNALYQLQDTWLINKIGLLDIHYSGILHKPWHAGLNGVVTEDKLRTYYLEWTNLSDTNQSQVEALLESFWSAFSGMPNQIQDNDMSQQQALDLLNITFPFSEKRLKLQFRRMLHKHHPDKGGNNSQTVQLYNAYDRLKTTCS